MELIRARLAESPLSTSDLLAAVRRAAPGVQLWEEGLEYLLASGEYSFFREGGLWHCAETADEKPAQERASVPDLPEILRLFSASSELGEDATEFLVLRIRATPVHGPEEQRELAAQRDLAIAIGDLEKIRLSIWALVWGSSALVLWVVKKFRAVGMERADMISAGILGLKRAAEKWDPEKGQFSTYGTHWIRQAIMRQAADESRLVRLPAHAHETWWKLRKKLGEDWESPQVAVFEAACKALDLEVEKAHPLLHASQDWLPWEELLELIDNSDADEIRDDPLEVDCASETSLRIAQKRRSELIEEGVAEDLLDPLVDKLDRRRLVDGVMGCLTDVEKEVVALRFGFGDSEPQTLEEVGKVFGVTRERVRQIQQHALEKLTKAVCSTTGRPLPGWYIQRHRSRRRRVA